MCAVCSLCVRCVQCVQSRVHKIFNGSSLLTSLLLFLQLLLLLRVVPRAPILLLLHFLAALFDVLPLLLLPLDVGLELVGLVLRPPLAVTVPADVAVEDVDLSLVLDDHRFVTPVGALGGLPLLLLFVVLLVQVGSVLPVPGGPDVPQRPLYRLQLSFSHSHLLYFFPFLPWP